MAWPEDELPLRFPLKRPVYAGRTDIGYGEPALPRDTSHPLFTKWL